MHKLYLLILIIALSSCGGGGGGGSTGGGSSTPTPPPASSDPVHRVTMSGSAITGMVQNATVNVYPLINGSKGRLLTTTQTDNSGRFILSLTSNEPTMLLIEVHGDSDAVVRCDNSSGCSYKGQTYSFNTNYAIDSDFVVQGVTYFNGTTTEQMHLTPLSDIVARVTKDKMSSMSILADGDQNILAQDILMDANNEVADLFHLPRNTMLTSIQPIDVTGRNTSSNLSHEQLKVSLIVSAFEDRVLEISTITDNIARKINSNQRAHTDKDRLFIKSMNTAQRFRLRNSNLSAMVNSLTSQMRDSISTVTPTLSITPPKLSLFSMPEFTSD